LNILISAEVYYFNDNNKYLKTILKRWVLDIIIIIRFYYFSLIILDNTQYTAALLYLYRVNTIKIN